jgi:hypothetical protein
MSSLVIWRGQVSSERMKGSELIYSVVKRKESELVAHKKHQILPKESANATVLGFARTSDRIEPYECSSGYTCDMTLNNR